jgi:hypothetical protein
MIVAMAARGLARLQDPRAVGELTAAGRQTAGEGLLGIVEALSYFDKANAREAAEALVPVRDAKMVATFRRQAQEQGAKGLFPW